MNKIKIIIAICLSVIVSSFAETILSLEDALDIAMENSPQIKQTKLSLERSQHSLNAQRAALKSNFSLSVNPFSYSHDRSFDRFANLWYTSENMASSVDFRIVQPILWTDGSFMITDRLQWQEAWSEVRNERDRTYSNNLYLSYNQPFFTYNRTKLALKELELDLENTTITYIVRKLALEYDVTLGFYDVYSAQLNYDIAKEEHNNTNDSYQIIKNKVDAGLAAMEELYQAELNLATSESKVQNNKVLLENSLDTFKKLIGVPVLDSIQIVGDVSHQVIKVEQQKALESGLKNRLELRQRSIDIETSYHSLIETMAMNEFRGAVNFTYGIIGVNENFKEMYDQATKDRKAEISFEIPLFDWGERKSRIKASEASIESRKVMYQEQEDDIIISIRQVIRNLENLVKQVEIEQQNVRNAQLTYDINLERYKNGDLTSMDLNLFQIQLSERKIGLVSAIINYKMALLNLKIQSMYDFVRNESVVPEDILKN